MLSFKCSTFSGPTLSVSRPKSLPAKELLPYGSPTQGKTLPRGLEGYKVLRDIISSVDKRFLGANRCSHLTVCLNRNCGQCDTT